MRSTRRGPKAGDVIGGVGCAAVLGLLIAAGGRSAASLQSAAPSTASQDAAAQSRALMQEGRRAFRMQDLPAAEAAARKVIAMEPGSAPAMYLLAYVLQARNQPKESLTWFTQAAEAHPPTGEDLRIVALDYVLLNDEPDALHWLERSVAMDPQNSEAWYDLARTRMTQGDYRGAEQPIARALALQPKMAKAENNLGLIYEAENRPADAEKSYRLAMEWQRSDAHPSEQPLLNLGALLTTEQRGAEAIPLLEQATTIAPRDAKCHEALARALDQQGQSARAATEMEKAVALDAKNPRLHFQLGQIYRRAGQPEKATEQMRLSKQFYGSQSSEPSKDPGR